MTVALTINGVVYDYPETNDEDWGESATDWATAVTQGMLQKAGGAFTLTAEVDFGATYGLKSVYFKSRNSSPSTTGQIRLGNTDTINYRNAADDGNITGYGVNGSNQPTFNGDVLQTGSAGDVTGPGSSTDNAVTRFDGTTGKLLQNSNATLSDAGDLVLAVPLKVASGGTNSGTALNNNRVMQSSSGSIVEASAITASRALVSDSNGIPTHATTTTTEINYVSGVTSAIQTQINTKLAATELTDWTSWTPSGSWSANTTYTGFHRRVGDTLQCRVNLAITGTPTSANLTISISNLSLTFDVAKLPGTGTNSAVGNGLVFDTSTGKKASVLVTYETTTTVALFYIDDLAGAGFVGIGIGGAITQAAPMTFANGDAVNVYFEVPCVEYA